MELREHCINVWRVVVSYLLCCQHGTSVFYGWIRMPMPVFCSVWCAPGKLWSVLCDLHVQVCLVCGVVLMMYVLHCFWALSGRAHMEFMYSVLVGTFMVSTFVFRMCCHHNGVAMPFCC